MNRSSRFMKELNEYRFFTELKLLPKFFVEYYNSSSTIHKALLICSASVVSLIGLLGIAAYANIALFVIGFLLLVESVKINIQQRDTWGLTSEAKYWSGYALAIGLLFLIFACW